MKHIRHHTDDFYSAPEAFETRFCAAPSFRKSLITVCKGISTYHSAISSDTYRKRIRINSILNHGDTKGQLCPVQMGVLDTC